MPVNPIDGDDEDLFILIHVFMQPNNLVKRKSARLEIVATSCHWYRVPGGYLPSLPLELESFAYKTESIFVLSAPPL